MNLPPLLSRRLWMLFPLLAAGFLVWTNVVRVERVEYVTNIARTGPAATAAAATGQIGGTRELIVPEHIGNSFEWIAQTQQMLARHEWRVRHIDYENAPGGRDVHAASPYRWWLGLVAMFDHRLTGRPLDAAVEHAALYADPLLHLLMLLATTAFVARQFGIWPGALLAAGFAAHFPFAAGFLPGVPDDFALFLLGAPWCVLPLLVGARLLAPPLAPAPAGRLASRWFALAGLVGGVGLWISVAGQVPLLIGVAVGALLAAWVQRRAVAENSAGSLQLGLWRTWSLAGAVTVLLCWLIEYYPDHLANWQLQVIHPLYGLAWLGGGELLGRTAGWIQRGGRPAWRAADLAVVLVSLAALASVPVVMWKTENLGFLSVDVLAFRLSKQADGVMAPNAAVWFKTAGLHGPAWGALLPLLLPGVAAWLALRRQTGATERASLALALGPVLVALGLAYLYLRWWQTLGGLLLCVLVVVTAALCNDPARTARRWFWVVLVYFALLPGLFQLLPVRGGVTNNVLTVPEVEGLVERDLAQWLAKHNPTPGGPVVLTAPSLTSSLYFYGGLRGLGTISWENKDGLAVAIRIVISTSREEALALIRQRGVTHIILPSWDNFYDAYTHASSMQTSELFFVSLDRWILPPWLRPVPYQLPSIGGYENQSVRILEVVDDQDDPVAASRLTEYFIEMGQLENAKIAGEVLRRYPADFGSLVARAQLAAALTDAEAFTAVFDPLQQRLAGGADRGLAWDRRVSLAVVLARGKRMDLARPQVQRCLADLTEARLRSLTTYSLYHLLVMNKSLGLEITDPRLRALAVDLLPDDFRQRL